jgi:peptidyl-prolyl cis-trans isomerase D
MALIGKIREKSGLLVIIIGLALLAFIMGDWQSMFGGSGESLGLGTVAGEKVDPVKYDNAVQAMQQQDYQQYQQQGREYTQRDQKVSEDKAWTMLVEGMVLETEFKKLGIDVSENEFEAYLYGTNGFTLMPSVAQSFPDSVTGQFNSRLLEKFLADMESTTDVEKKNGWITNKANMREQRKAEKYFQLLEQGAYVTKLEAQEEYKAQKEVKNISYVVRRYAEIADEKIKVSEQEVKDYYEEHKSEKKYESTAGRDVKIFDIAIQPSKADSTKFNKTMDVLKKQFSTTKTDSIFVLQNSEVKFFYSDHKATFRPEGDPKARQGLTYPVYMDTIFKSASKGQIVGPYNDKGRVRLAKVLDFNTKVLKVRHILLTAPKGDEAKIAAAQKLADSLMKTLNKDNFGEYVTKYSEDGGSKDKGGVYEDFMDYEMVPEFSKFATDKPIGTIGSVKTEYGIHIIEVLDRKEVKYPVLALIEKTLLPSTETEDNASDEAYDVLYSFDEKISRKEGTKAKIDLFDTLAQREGYFVRPVRILDENPAAQGFVTPYAEDKVLKLAYDENSEVGTLCSAPIKDQGRYIIAIVSSIREKGVPKFEDVEREMRLAVIKDKKAKIFIEQMINEKSLEAMAKKGSTTVMQSQATFASPQIQNAGYEPEVVGSLFSGLKDGARTIPLKGETGVYVVRIDKTIKAPATANFDSEKQQMLAAYKGNLQNDAKRALLKTADAKDNRRFNALGIRR